PYPSSAEILLRALPHGMAASALLLARATWLGGALAQRARDALECAALRTPSSVEAPVAPAGQVLGLLEAARESSAGVEAALTHAKRGLAAEVPADDTRALLDSLEVALAAADLSGDPGYRDRAELLGQRLLSVRRRTGSWFPRSFVADRHELSAIWGVGAIARAFARLHDPGRVGSLRVLRLPA